MKNSITLCLVFCSIAAFAQRTVTKDVGDFSELKVYDLIEVNLIQSNENKVVIKGNHTDDVKIINQNGKLKLRMELDTRFQGEDTYIEVYFKKIRIIDANEGSYIVGNEMIEQDRIELKAQEGGRIKVGLTVDHTKIKAVTGGVIEASGLSKTQEIKLNTGGIFEGRELITKETKIGITAAGEAEVNATDLVEVRVTAGGDVNIYGNPKEVSEKKIAGGRVKIMN
jgi:hypothetical protein